MADTLRDIGAQMANVMFNLAQRPGDALTGDVVATMDSLRKQWDAAVRAAPPSSSTTPEVDERAAFEAWNNSLGQESFGIRSVPNLPLAAWAAWQARAALASRPAEVEDKPCDLCKGTGETKMRAAGAVWHHTCARCKGKGSAPSRTTNKEK